ncbi:MAG: hypothetical protein IJ430_01310 [Parabacteroides sp.]|nr:hypothetical protein [Parabacteroides sp.]
MKNDVKKIGILTINGIIFILLVGSLFLEKQELIMALVVFLICQCGVFLGQKYRKK